VGRSEVNKVSVVWNSVVRAWAVVGEKNNYKQVSTNKNNYKQVSTNKQITRVKSKGLKTLNQQGKKAFHCSLANGTRTNIIILINNSCWGRRQNDRPKNSKKKNPCPGGPMPWRQN